ncbi:hypothetical protein, partial [Pseudomonas syringae]|uniref:hypothetical protein n=1 Tax=Pseudomonas syringae TaxID=317 RepID=UPI0034D650F1
AHDEAEDSGIVRPTGDIHLETDSEADRTELAFPREPRLEFYWNVLIGDVYLSDDSPELGRKKEICQQRQVAKEKRRSQR